MGRRTVPIPTSQEGPTTDICSLIKSATVGKAGWTYPNQSPKEKFRKMN
jgi:hypothetical protein